MPTIDMLSHALAAHAAGLCVVPPTQDGAKRPIGEWKLYQTKRPSDVLLRQWYSNGRTGIGWITGAVSGGVEVIDFDDRSIFAEYRRLAADAGLGHLVERLCHGYLEYSPNGAHIAYRCDTIAGNKKLAQRASDKKSLIETRGEGGYIITAPSHGGVNKNGSYEMQTGGVDSIQTITPEERQALFYLAGVFDEIGTPPLEKKYIPPAIHGTRPGDDYSANAQWVDILEPHGWTKAFTRDSVEYWRRPGKSRDHSATVNFGGSGLFWCFSTSTIFDTQTSYGKFATYAMLNHGGDFSAAAAALASLGYGRQIRDEDFSDLTVGETTMPVVNPEIPSDMRDLLRVPGMLGDLCAWINTRSNRPQPVLAMAGAIAGMAAIIGRKVRSRSNLRPNIYVIGVGGTGCGKEAARLALRDIYREIGQSQMVGESFASDASIESALLDHPSSLYLIDEIGLFFGMVRNTRNMAPHIAGIMPMFLKLYGASESTYRRRTYADRESNKDSESTIEQPALSIYGTSVPSNWYGALSREYLANGLISRLLVFDAHDPLPKRQVPDDNARDVPASILEWFKAWHAQSVNPDAIGNIDSLTPKPMVANETAAASEIFADLDADMDKRVLAGGCGDDVVPYTRVWTMAVKLALIRGCGVCGASRVEITANDAEWAAKLAIRQTDAFVKALLGSVSDNNHEAIQQRIVSMLGAGGWVGHNVVTRALQGHTPKERKDAMDTLIESGITEERVVEGRVGRPRREYRLAGGNVKM